MAKKLKQASPADSRLSPETLAFLGLEQQPFSNNILSAEAIFSHAALTQLKDTIKHHLQFSDLLLIVEGNYGSGKTTFFRQLMQEEIANVFLMPIQAEATDTLTQIQQKMSIHLKEQGDANYLDDNLKNLQVFDQTPVLMIDDAHVLSDTTLQEVIRYREQLLSEKQLSLKILLLANRGMAATIEQITDLQHNQLFVQDVPALKARQIQGFIAHRLVSAGGQQPPLIDDKQVLSIYKNSAGSPLAVMQQSAAVLEKLSKKSKRSVNLALPARPVLLLGLLVLVVAIGIAIYVLPLTDTNPQPATESSTPAMAPAAPGVTEQPKPLDPSPPSTPEPDPMAPQPPIAGPAQEDVVPPPPARGDMLDPVEAIPQPVAEEPPATDDAEDIPEPILQQPARDTVDGLRKPAVGHTEPTVRAAPPSPPAPAMPVESPPTAPLDAALQALGKLGVKDRNWLLEQNPSHWTLQILGAREPETLLKFARKHRLGANTAWYRTDLKGKPWYVLVHRFYTDRDIARQSIQRLPEGLRQASPWVRSVASVHKSLTN